MSDPGKRIALEQSKKEPFADLRAGQAVADGKPEEIGAFGHRRGEDDLGNDSSDQSGIDADGDRRASQVKQPVDAARVLAEVEWVERALSAASGRNSLEGLESGGRVRDRCVARVCDCLGHGWKWNG